MKQGSSNDDDGVSDNGSNVQVTGTVANENKAGKVDVNGRNTATETEENSNIDRKNVVSAGEKRSLRSHDSGSRSSCDLAMYFPNYEQVIDLEPAKKGTLDSMSSFTPLAFN